MKGKKSNIDVLSSNFIENEISMKKLLKELNSYFKLSKLEGNKDKIKRTRKRKKLLAREKIDLLLDKNKPHIELMSLAGLKHENGFGAGGTTVVVLGYVSNVLCLINANVATRKAGAIDYATSLKNLRLSQIANENKLLTINLVESGGANLPDQDRVFNNYGKFFMEMSRRSKKGIPTISVVFGNATAGGAYVPGMSDYSILQKNAAKVFLAGPPLVKMATNEDANEEELGGAQMHSSISGVSDFLANDEKHAIEITKNLIKKIKQPATNNYDSDASSPKFVKDEILGIIPSNLKKPFDIRELIKRFVDSSEFIEFKENYGRTMFCCWTKINGYPIGIIANNGVIFIESARKATHFIQLANKSNTPLLFVHNTTGFMVGKRYEQNGMINSGSQLIHAVAGSTVPHISLQVGNSYGAGNYAMCGRSFDPRFLFSYPNAKSGVMGADQLAGVMEIVKRNSASSLNKVVDEEKLKIEKKRLAEEADEKASVWHTTSEVWDDGVIDPRDTRKYLSLALAAVYSHEIKGSSSFGVFRM
ncbi:MAG TPA: carboxyl transferase domain-containing protein [Flavobacteriaceae bacterium]|nr:carboxyl transferase domain-containing protein [Flavobacteriaceae bacterium]